jgi:cell fate regulator YaaT (PSP1 superfamily)
MCCLRYESEVYSEEIKKTPSNDTLVRTEDGVGVVIGSNPLAGTIRVLLKESPDTAPKQYHRDNVTVLGKEHRSEQGKNAKAREQKAEKESKTDEKEDKKQ